jgi:hypothetical protein
MKNFAFAIIAAICFSFNGNAQNNDISENGERIESAYLSISSDNEVVKYKFGSIKDLEENSAEIIEGIAENAAKNNEEKSKVSVELFFTISKGVLSGTYMEKIMTDYKRIVEETKKLQNKLIASIK